MLIVQGTTAALKLSKLTHISSTGEEIEPSVIHGATPGMTIPARYLPKEPRTYTVNVLEEARVQRDDNYPDLLFQFVTINADGLNFEVTFNEELIGFARLKENKLTLCLPDGTAVADVKTLYVHAKGSAND